MNNKKIAGLLISLVLIVLIISIAVLNFSLDVETISEILLIIMLVLGLGIWIVFWAAIIIYPMFFSVEMKSEERKMRANFVEYLFLAVTLLVTLGNKGDIDPLFVLFVIGAIGYFTFLLNPYLLEDEESKLISPVFSGTVLLLSSSLLFIVSGFLDPSFFSQPIQSFSNYGVTILISLIILSLTMMPTEVIQSFYENPGEAFDKIYGKILKRKNGLLGGFLKWIRKK